MNMLPENYYPTPPELIDKMLSGIDFNAISSVLEPSAGKGDIAEAVRRRVRGVRLYNNRNDETIYDIDCVEIDENLRHILKGRGHRVIADDFLRFDTAKHYDLIVANPPFDAGDKHLLRMLDMQKNGGGIVCLLNAETLRNPYTDTRKSLVARLDELGADISYVSGAFERAERRTAVEVAIVKVYIPDKPKSVILEGMQRASNEQGADLDESAALADRDIVKQIAREYSIVADAARRLISEYEGISPYLQDARGERAVEITLHGYARGHGVYESVTINDVLPVLRKRYWSMLFSSPKFIARLTSNLRDELHKRVDELSNYDPSEHNIRTLQIEMSKQVIKGLEDTILSMFDRLSRVNSWDGEHSKNIHYFDGWKTNKSWKINKKVIQPIAAFEEWRGKYTFYPYCCADVLTDIEKVFTYLDTEKTPLIDIANALKEARDFMCSTVELAYFDVRFYKKGTCHITFKNLDLLAKFNLYGSQRKGWLPPSYGKARYDDMSREEQAVIDDYEGVDAYEKVMQCPEYYIVETSELLKLESAT